MMNKEHDPNEPVAYINLDEKRLEWAVPFEFKSSCFVLGKLPLYLHPPKTAETEAEPVLYIKEQELLYIQVLKQEGLAQEWKSNLGFVKEAGDVGLYLHPPNPAEPEADTKTHILPQPDALYRHHSGKVYQVLEIAKMEATGEVVIVYRERGSIHRVWVRPASEWWDKFKELV
jgi:hypothetical protein